MSTDDLTNMSLSKKLSIGLIVFVCFICLIFLGSVFENLDVHQIMCIQSPISGTINWYTTPGWKVQKWGKITKYSKMGAYQFQIQVRFNDGGHGTMVGSVNYEMPYDTEHLNLLQSKFGSEDAVRKNLIEVVVNKCVYMTGPMMSSKESYAEKRTSLIRYVEDQISNGVYKTTQKDVQIKDPITGQEKTVTMVEIVTDKDGNFERQEDAVLSSYGIKTSNFAVTSLPYDDTVEAQIKQQQEINMKVQTAMAAAKEAEQNAITVSKQGEANAAKAKWEQEVVKAKAIVEAQQQLEVARLNRLAAEQEKMKNILLGEGEAERKRLVMNADGALSMKLDAYKSVMTVWAQEFSKQKWVPEIVMGEQKGGQNSAVEFLNILGVKAARDLSLDMSVPKGHNKGAGGE